MLKWSRRLHPPPPTGPQPGPSGLQAQQAPAPVQDPIQVDSSSQDSEEDNLTLRELAMRAQERDPGQCVTEPGRPGLPDSLFFLSKIGQKIVLYQPGTPRRVAIILPKGYINPLVRKVLPQAALKHVSQNSWPGVLVKSDNMGGHGLFADKDFAQGMFICHYGGDLLDQEGFSLAKCDKFMLEIELNDEKWWVNHNDKTPFSFGKMMNHSRTCPNSEKTIFQDEAGQPVIVFKALKKISCGEEIVHNYGKKYGYLPPCTINCKKCKSKFETPPPPLSLGLFP